ncbi:MAG: glucose-6-phosphate isomerase [Candidatus Delongbacteria bacterium]|nr:glucose-6-phosphate isomerase [Candidatus Delongbacteria bacterium]
MKRITLDGRDAWSMVRGKPDQLYSKIESIIRQELMTNRSRWAGWFDLPESMTAGDELPRIEELAAEIRRGDHYLVVIGIGGSYLGARALIHALSPVFSPCRVIFAGYQMDPSYLQRLLEFLEDKSYYVNVISKSGGTIEPAVTFRVIKQAMERKYSREEISRRIIVTTDRSRGILKALADAQGFRCFVIPDDVGGRFSALTPVGLLPVACAGISPRNLLKGAAEFKDLSLSEPGDDNPVYAYAALRDCLHREGKSIEILSCFSPALSYFAEWWKQLFGESEGKNGHGLFPASAQFTTDLHSLGQWIQDGPRIIMETFLYIRRHPNLIFPSDPLDFDHLNYLSGRSMDDINYQAYQGTCQAHRDGQVPVIRIELDELSAESMGHLIMMFEITTSVNGYLMGINPFDQPGVETYKKNMFSLLNCPGY